MRECGNGLAFLVVAIVAALVALAIVAGVMGFVTAAEAALVRHV